MLTVLYFVPVALNIVKAREELEVEEIGLSESTLTMFSYGAFVNRLGKESYSQEDIDKRNDFANILGR